MCETRPATFAVAPLLYLRSVLIVQAASAAVSGLPSLHLAFGWVLNVHDLPSFEARHDRAENGAEWGGLWCGRRRGRTAADALEFVARQSAPSRGRSP